MSTAETTGQNDRRNGLFGIGGTAQGQEAERAILIDGLTFPRRVLSVSEPIQEHQRVLVLGRRVEIARGRQRILDFSGADVGGGAGDDRRNCKSDPDPHFFLKSTLIRAGALSETVAV